MYTEVCEKTSRRERLITEGIIRYFNKYDDRNFWKYRIDFSCKIPRDQPLAKHWGGYSSYSYEYRSKVVRTFINNCRRKYMSWMRSTHLPYMFVHEYTPEDLKTGLNSFSGHVHAIVGLNYPTKCIRDERGNKSGDIFSDLSFMRCIRDEAKVLKRDKGIDVYVQTCYCDNNYIGKFAKYSKDREMNYGMQKLCNKNSEGINRAIKDMFIQAEQDEAQKLYQVEVELRKKHWYYKPSFVDTKQTYNPNGLWYDTEGGTWDNNRS